MKAGRANEAKMRGGRHPRIFASLNIGSLPTATGAFRTRPRCFGSAAGSVGPSSAFAFVPRPPCHGRCRTPCHELFRRSIMASVSTTWVRSEPVPMTVRDLADQTQPKATPHFPEPSTARSDTNSTSLSLAGAREENRKPEPWPCLAVSGNHRGFGGYVWRNVLQYRLCPPPMR